MNETVVIAKVKRSTTQQVQISWDKAGHGDDIVDQWADRLIEGMKATVAHITRAMQDGALPAPLRKLPEGESADRYYHRIYICENCRWLNILWFVKGKRAPTSVACEKCECNTAEQKP